MALYFGHLASNTYGLTKLSCNMSPSAQTFLSIIRQRKQTDKSDHQPTLVSPLIMGETFLLGLSLCRYRYLFFNFQLVTMQKKSKSMKSSSHKCYTHGSMPSSFIHCDNCGTFLLKRVNWQFILLSCGNTFLDPHNFHRFIRKWIKEILWQIQDTKFNEMRKCIIKINLVQSEFII